MRLINKHTLIAFALCIIVTLALLDVLKDFCNDFIDFNISKILFHDSPYNDWHA